METLSRAIERQFTAHSDNYFDTQNEWLVEQFSGSNVITYGKKGTGKDLIHAHVIALRGEEHYANMEYNANTEVIPLTRISLGKNTYENVLADNITKIAPVFDFGRDIYITDGGIFLPSQYNNKLNDNYPSMSLFYPVSRHLGVNIHINVQALGRIWDKLREQADCFIRCRRTIELGKFLFVRVITYDEYNAASKNLLPCSDPQFIAANGEITERFIRIPKKHIKYDTHYFRKVFYDYEEEKIPLLKGFQYV